MQAKPEAREQGESLAGTLVRDGGLQRERQVGETWPLLDALWSRDNRRIIYCHSGLSKVNLTFKVLATRSTVLSRGCPG